MTVGRPEEERGFAEALECDLAFLGRFTVVVLNGRKALARALRRVEGAGVYGAGEGAEGSL